MKKAFIWIDIWSISTKWVVIDEENNIVAQSYLWTEWNPIWAVKNLLKELEKQFDKSAYEILWSWTTWSARELIGKIIDASIVKNEITAHTVGTLTFHPEVNTIFEIWWQDSKIIIIENWVVIDYAMNTLCAAWTGAFLVAQSKRLGIWVEEFGEYAVKSTTPAKIAWRCTVFAESDLVHKAQMWYTKEDLVAWLCDSIVNNYLNNVGKWKNIKAPIIFQWWVSKNIWVIKSFEKITWEKIIVDENWHLMWAIWIAILARDSGKQKLFNFDIWQINFKTQLLECWLCPNNCEIVCILKDWEFLDAWWNRCAAGYEKTKKTFKKE